MDPHAACRVLGVPPGASEADIKSAYRNAALKFHPDRNAGLGADAERVAAEHFRRASEAYDVLSSPGGRYASRARRSGSGGPSQGRKSGYYNGAADPFGFQHRHSQRVGDHMRRIDGNIRALYATLAVVGVMLYLAPQPKSPAEINRRRRKTDRSTHTFTERAVTSLAPGSPLDTNDDFFDARRNLDARRRNAVTNRTISSSLVDDDVLSSSTVDHWTDDVFGTRFRYAYEGGGEWKGPVLSAADAARDARASAKASFSRRYGSAGERAFASHRSNSHEKTKTDEDLRSFDDDDDEEEGPEWARGGYVGRGVSRRVLPYHRRRLGRGGGGGFGDDDVYDDDDSGSSRGLGAGIACARCRGALPLTARFCSICGARVTSPASVVAAAAAETSAGWRKKMSPSATPLADPQDTGSSAGRGRARAAADREANARAEAG